MGPYHHTKRFLAKYAAQQVVKQEPANDHLINLGHLSQRISAMRDMGCHPSQQFPGDHERFSPSPRLKAEYKQELCFGVDPHQSSPPNHFYPEPSLQPSTRTPPSPSIPATSCPPSPAGYLSLHPHVQNPRSHRPPFCGSSFWVCGRTRRAARRTSSGWTGRGGCSSWWTARRCPGCGAPTRTSPT